jgi:hypothetical protein
MGAYPAMHATVNKYFFIAYKFGLLVNETTRCTGSYQLGGDADVWQGCKVLIFVITKFVSRDLFYIVNNFVVQVDE